MKVGQEDDCEQLDRDSAVLGGLVVDSRVEGSSLDMLVHMMLALLQGVVEEGLVLNVAQLKNSGEIVQIENIFHEEI
jgi:hypothetical protein